MVEVLPERYLFALIGEDTKYIGMRTFEKEIGGFSVTPTGLASISKVRGTQDVPRKYYPLLVTFTDIADPTTVRKVDPDNLAASFGPGVTLKRITLKITDEDVTKGKVENLLSWLGWPREKFLVAGGRQNPLKVSGDSLDRSNFVWKGN